MERMADANMRVVEANSWPFVDLTDGLQIRATRTTDPSSGDNANFGG
jgi:hypothetical protein